MSETTKQNKPSGSAGGRRDQESGRKDRDRGGRPQGKGKPQGRPARDEGPRLPPLEIRSVVDRGTVERAAGEGEEARTEAAPWTVTKVVKADARTRKPLETVYELAVGGETVVHKSLGAAREAVGKTIVHPEKTTKSKAEHASSKGKGGGKK